MMASKNLPLGTKKALQKVEEYLEALEKECAEMLKEREHLQSNLPALQKARLDFYKSLDVRDFMTVVEDDVARERWAEAHLKALEATIRAEVREMEVDEEARKILEEKKRRLETRLQKLDPSAALDDQVERVGIRIRGVLRENPAMAARVFDNLLPELREAFENKCSQLSEDIALLRTQVTKKAIRELEGRVLKQASWLRLQEHFQALEAPRLTKEREENLTELLEELAKTKERLEHLSRKEEERLQGEDSEARLRKLKIEFDEVGTKLGGEVTRREKAESDLADTTAKLRASEANLNKALADVSNSAKKLLAESSARQNLESELRDTKAQNQADKEQAALRLQQSLADLEEKHRRQLVTAVQEAELGKTSLAEASKKALDESLHGQRHAEKDLGEQREAEGRGRSEGISNTPEPSAQ